MSRQFLIGAMLAAFALSPGSAPAAEAGYAPQVSDAEGVKITATLEGTPAQAKTWAIAVSMETHTHPLGEALEAASVLIADGRQYHPLAWEGSPPGGHHRKGTLRFPAISPLPDAVELQIRLSGESAPRSFKWRLK